MNNKKSPMRFLQGKGFYVALALIIGGAAIASFLAISEMLQDLQTPMDTNSIAGQEDIPWDSPTKQVEQKQIVPATSTPASPSQNTASSGSQSQSASQASAAPAGTPGSQTPSYTSPLAQASILQMYSGEELVFNETMGDWRTHNGTDLAGQAQQAVVAPLSGTVKKAYTDDMWGGVVEIEQGTVVVRLMGIAAPLMVKEGDTVKTGDALGKLGTIAVEATLAPHLHVEIEQNGTAIDPASLLQYQ